MKYSDRQRLQKIAEVGHRLLTSVEKEHLTSEQMGKAHLRAA